MPKIETEIETDTREIKEGRNKDKRQRPEKRQKHIPHTKIRDQRPESESRDEDKGMRK